MDAATVLANYWRKYQRKIMKDKSRLIAVVKARQIGLTELSSSMAIQVALSGDRSDVWLLGVNHEGSKEILYRAKHWYKIFKLVIPNLPSIKSESTESMSFSNGSRITALPCSESSVRGKSGTVIMDEAAHYQKDHDIWRGIAAAISSNKHLRLLMFSTPFGERGIFWKAVTGKLDGENLKWSVHSIDIHQAIAEGHSKDSLDLRSSYTQDQWEQEFLCSFLSQVDKYFPADLITDCYEAILDQGEKRVVAKKILGIDLASKRDQSVTIECDFDGESNYRFHSPTILSDRNKQVTYAAQFPIINTMIEKGLYDRVIVDATGPGAGLASFLKEKHGSLIIEHNATHQWKAKFIPALKVDMESDCIEIENNKDLVKAFNSVKETRSVSNNVIYVLSRDEIDHADLFSASLMAYSVVKSFPNEKQGPSTIITISNKETRSKRNDRY